jgi:hypothetical protein
MGIEVLPSGSELTLLEGNTPPIFHFLVRFASCILYFFTSGRT